MSGIGPGDRVECVRDDWDYAGPAALPVKCRIYTVRAVFHRSKASGFPCGIQLEEIKNPSRQYRDGFGEIKFNLSNFRLIRSTDTGMEILRRAMKDALDGVPA